MSLRVLRRQRPTTSPEPVWDVEGDLLNPGVYIGEGVTRWISVGATVLPRASVSDGVGTTYVYYAPSAGTYAVNARIIPTVFVPFGQTCSSGTISVSLIAGGVTLHSATWTMDTTMGPNTTRHLYYSGGVLGLYSGVPSVDAVPWAQWTVTGISLAANDYIYVSVYNNLANARVTIVNPYDTYDTYNTIRVDAP